MDEEEEKEFPKFFQKMPIQRENWIGHPAIDKEAKVSDFYDLSPGNSFEASNRQQMLEEVIILSARMEALKEENMRLRQDCQELESTFKEGEVIPRFPCLAAFRQYHIIEPKRPKKDETERFYYCQEPKCGKRYE